MECGLTSLEGEISRFLAISCLSLSMVAKAWHFAAEFFGLVEHSALGRSSLPQRLVFWMDRWLDAFFRALARYWGTLGLLLLAFAIATLVPTYELTTLQPQFLRNLPPELRTARTGITIDTYQFGAWLLVLFVVGFVSQMLIGKARTRETKGRLFIVSASWAVVLYTVSVFQDYLGQ